MSFGKILKKIARSFGYSLQKMKRSESEDDILHRLFTLAGIDLVIDAGANHGAFAQLCRQAGYTGEIWCFEPNRDCISALRAKSSDDKGLKVFPMATGRGSATAQLNVAGSDGNMGSLLAQEEWLTTRFRSAWVRESYDVPVSRIDDVLDREGVSDQVRILLKMDTQGYDLATFEGMGNRMTQVLAIKGEYAVQTIYKEAPEHWVMIDRLRAGGFEPFWFSTISRTKDGRLIEYDAYFVRTDFSSNL